MADARSIREFKQFDSSVPEVGILLGAMQEVRANLLDSLGRVERAPGFGQEFLDWRGPTGGDNSVGALLYHIAGVELGWLYTAILLGDASEEMAELLPAPAWDEHERLSQVPGIPLERHLELLAEARRRYLEVVGPMSMDEWKELRSPPDEDFSMSTEWVTFHLVEHEAGHLYQIHRLIRLWLEKHG